MTLKQAREVLYTRPVSLLKHPIGRETESFLYLTARVKCIPSLQLEVSLPCCQLILPAAATTIMASLLTIPNWSSATMKIAQVSLSFILCLLAVEVLRELLPLAL